MTTMQNILRKAIYFVSMVHLPFLFKLYKRFCKGGSRYIDEFSLSLSLCLKGGVVVSRLWPLALSFLCSL